MYQPVPVDGTTGPGAPDIEQPAGRLEMTGIQLKVRDGVQDGINVGRSPSAIKVGRSHSDTSITLIRKASDVKIALDGRNQDHEQSEQPEDPFVFSKGLSTAEAEM